QMTISYSGSFIRLLLRWKGSIWRSTWKELLFFLIFYYAVRFFYVFGIPMIFEDDEKDMKRFRAKFESLCHMFENFSKQIPLTFLLGFFVSNVVSRWWSQFQTLSWPEDLLSGLCLIMPGNDDRSKKRRHTVARYLNLTSALAWRDISSKIRIRFPHLKSIEAAGLATEKEMEKLEIINQSCPHARWMAPLHWIQHIVMQEVKDNNPMASLVNTFMKDLQTVRASYRKLFSYDWVTVPLPYSQVAALATYAFFFFCLFGRQFVYREKETDRQIDLFIPIFTIVQFLFFVGWLKIGQDLMRPFGTDDDDIELLYIFERNVSTSFAIVHQLQDNPPPLDGSDEDVFWKQAEAGETVTLNTTAIAIHKHAPKLHSYVTVKSEETEEDTAKEGCNLARRSKK
ncbi:hypothetical protein PFISCL1PPCAC_16433, partial [Pristionchus fissidentatus]